MGFFGFGKKQAMPAAPGGIETGPLPPTTVETQGPMPPSIAPTLETKPLNVGPSILPIGANTASTEAWHAAKLESMGTPSTVATTEPVTSEAPAPSAVEVVPALPTESAEAIAPLTPPVAEDEGDNPSKNAPPASEPHGEEAERLDTTPTQPVPDAKPAVTEAPAVVEPEAVIPRAERVLSPEDEEAWAKQQEDKKPEAAADPQPDILANIGHMESPTANPAEVPATPIVGGMEQPQGGNVLNQVADVVNKIPDSPVEQAEAVAGAAGGLPAADAAPAAVQTETPAAPEPVAA